MRTIVNQKIQNRVFYKNRKGEHIVFSHLNKKNSIILYFNRIAMKFKDNTEKLQN